MWGEKTGCFTNADRTVHISHKAVDPPGECRSDFDVFLDYAARLGLQDKDGRPLIKWSSPEACFEAWKAVTSGCACDYTGLSYAKLTGGSGVQWPCNAQRYPNGCERLYADGRFPTGMDDCESYGHDLVTGAPLSRQEYAALNPDGRAVFKAAQWTPPHEAPDEAFPFWRNVYHFHSRTKTGRAPHLQSAAPEAYVEMHPSDAEARGIAEGTLVRVSTRRGHVTVPAKLTSGVEPGLLFLPFHYGYFDADGRHRAANELTKAGWDPVSKQPFFKYGAAKVEVATVGMTTAGAAGGRGGGSGGVIGRALTAAASALLPGSHEPLGQAQLVSAAPAGGDVSTGTGAPRGPPSHPTATTATDVIGDSSSDRLQRIDPPAMAPPSAKPNAIDVLSTPDPTARRFLPEQVLLLSSQLEEVASALQSLRQYPQEQEARGR